ncbi:MAG: DUF1080 domain-containing protein [Luteolibacter sp.]|uniref:3-keto-disaccharide hydrolase n=1 Tax=Luteolibacter sp. TaxID=1962973 RepID=UPI00326459BF
MRHPAALLFVLSLFASTSHASPEVELFNGHDFAGWEFVTVPALDIKEVCTFKPGGVIAVAGKPVGFIATTVSHTNYMLHAEWRWRDKPGNGGLLVHISSGPKDRAWPLSFQIQTKNGNTGDLLPMAGATFAEPLTSAPNAAPALKGHIALDSEKSPGEWNTCDITCRGDTIEIMINGVRQNAVTRVNPASGRVGFQLEGVPFELRHVRLTPLD